MFSFRRFVPSGLALAMALCSPLLNAQLQQKLEAQYALTKTTADRSDIVTAGAVLVLQKDDLLMDTTTSTTPIANTYKGGKLTHGMGDFVTNKWLRKMPGASPAPNVDSRTFVSGEKFWVTKIEMHDDGVLFYLFSDPISDVRYYSTLKFPFPKGSTPDTDKMMSQVAEVLKVDDSGGDSKQQTAAPAAPAPGAAGQPAVAPAQATAQAPSTMAPIAAPPPPADAPPPQPKTVALGQTKDQVVAIFGQPAKVANLGSKEIDYYPDFKITFVGGKVTNVQ
jgi:hypothetical protein